MVTRGTPKGIYVVSFDFIPTTDLDDLTPYLAIRNTSTNRRVLLRGLRALLRFGGTTAITFSVFALRRFVGAFAATGTPAAVAIVPESLNSRYAEATISDVLMRKEGLAAGTAVLSTKSPLARLVGADVGYVAGDGYAPAGPREFDLARGSSESDLSRVMDIPPAGGVAICADGAVTAGTRVIGEAVLEELPD
jgi:hypothetical protein